MLQGTVGTVYFALFLTMEKTNIIDKLNLTQCNFNSNDWTKSI